MFDFGIPEEEEEENLFGLQSSEHPELALGPPPVMGAWVNQPIPPPPAAPMPAPVLPAPAALPHAPPPAPQSTIQPWMNRGPGRPRKRRGGT
jgi:hypothetical protein